jgi:hypothetical protein
MSAEITAITLTFNKEQNIAYALRSVFGWARQVVVVDSFSTVARSAPHLRRRHAGGALEGV